MNRRIVDVFLQDRLIASYPVVVEDVGALATTEDFIEYVRERLRTRVPDVDVARARFIVRTTSE